MLFPLCLTQINDQAIKSSPGINLNELFDHPNVTAISVLKTVLLRLSNRT